MPAGLPPLPHYRLDLANRAGPGSVPDRVLFHRDEDPALPDARPVQAGSVQQALRSWLLLLGSKDTAEWLATAHDERVRWTGEPAMRRRLRPLVWAADRAFAAAKTELLRRGALLRCEWRSASQHLVIELVDDRGDTTRPLPDPASLLPPRR